MKTSLSLVKLALCGPGDVAPEIAIAKEVIRDWNLLMFNVKTSRLPMLHWLTDCHPDLRERAQAVINRQMVDDSEIIVATLHHLRRQPPRAELCHLRRRSLRLRRRVHGAVPDHLRPHLRP
jgi:hypothetical protein